MRTRAIFSIAVGLSLIMPTLVVAQTTVYYLPAEYPEVCAWDLTNGGPACDGTANRARRFCMSGLTGLDIAREALGLASCPEESQAISISGIDYVMLVDDRTLSPALSALFGDAVRDLGGGPLIFPTRTAADVTPRGIVIGERLYQDRINSRAEWLARVASLLDLATEARDLPVQYHADYQTFREAVEDALCPIMLCRSDGRERMRTLIDQVEEQLREVHGGAGSFSGGLVPVTVMLHRQPDREDRIDRLGFGLGTEVDFGDDEESVPTAERPSADPVVDDVEGDMTTSAGTRPPSARGDERYAVALPYMAHLTAYAVTMSWLTDPNTPMDDQVLPTRRPAHPNGCAAPRQQQPNREGCEAALSHWRELEIGQRRLLRMHDNRAELRRRLSERYCREFDHFCEECSCDTRF